MVIVSTSSYKACIHILADDQVQRAEETCEIKFIVLNTS